MNISVKEFRGRLREILDRVGRGDSITITVHGEPRVQLSRIDDADDVAVPETPAAFGMWADRTDMDDVDAYVRDLRRGRHDRS